MSKLRRRVQDYVNKARDGLFVPSELSAADFVVSFSSEPSQHNPPASPGGLGLPDTAQIKLQDRLLGPALAKAFLQIWSRAPFDAKRAAMRTLASLTASWGTSPRGLRRLGEAMLAHDPTALKTATQVFSPRDQIRARYGIVSSELHDNLSVLKSPDSHGAGFTHVTREERLVELKEGSDKLLDHVRSGKSRSSSPSKSPDQSHERKVTKKLSIRPELAALNSHHMIPRNPDLSTDRPQHIRGSILYGRSVLLPESSVNDSSRSTENSSRESSRSGSPYKASNSSELHDSIREKRRRNAVNLVYHRESI